MNSNWMSLGMTASTAAMLISTTAIFAGTLGDDFLVKTSGEGLIFADPDEDVLPPGAKAVTFTRTRVQVGEDEYICRSF